MARNISDEIDLDKEVEVFLLEGSKSDVLEYLVSLPQVENTQNLYPNFSFTIVIVFTVVQVSIKYRDYSKFHYRPALNKMYMYKTKLAIGILLITESL